MKTLCISKENKKEVDKVVCEKLFIDGTWGEECNLSLRPDWIVRKLDYLSDEYIYFIVEHGSGAHTFYRRKI